MLPAKEVILHDEQLADIVYRIRNRASEQGLPVTQVRLLVEQINQQHGFAGIESLIPLIYDKLGSLLDYFGQDPLIVISDRNEVEKAALEFEQNCAASFEASTADTKLCVTPDRLYTPWSDSRAVLYDRKSISFQLVDIQTADPSSDSAPYRFKADILSDQDLSVETKANPKSLNPLRPLADWIAAHTTEGRQTLVVCQTRMQSERLMGLLSPYGIELRPSRGVPEDPLSSTQTLCVLWKVVRRLCLAGTGAGDYYRR